MSTEPIHHIWQAMAEHFLDTETRHLIPYTAWLCHHFVLTDHEITAIWAHDVTPVLFWNLYNIAGEWAGWDAQWLVSQIERKRRARLRGTTQGWWLYRLQIGRSHPILTAILACRMLYWHTQDDQRERLHQSFFWLAKVYFDMHAGQIDVPADELKTIFHTQFLPIFKPLSDDNADITRVMSALEILDVR